MKSETKMLREMEGKVVARATVTIKFSYCLVCFVKCTYLSFGAYIKVTVAIARLPKSG